MDIYPATAKEVMARWHEITPILEKAMPHARGKFALHHILTDIGNGISQAWIVQRDGLIEGVAITQVIDYPQKSMLFVICVAGKRFSLWDNIVNDHFIPYARHYRCSGIEFLGRPGWLKRAAVLGFKPVQTLFELEIDHQGE